MKYLKGILLPALLALASFAAAKDEPLVEKNAFQRELVNLFYFDDSEVILSFEFETGVVWRSEDSGKNWGKLKNIETIGIIKNPFDKNTAIALGPQRHYITFNQGKDWDEFDTKLPPTLFGLPVSWHRDDPKKILFSTFENCRDLPCLGTTLYTEDGFKSIKVLREDRKMCIWARSSELFLADSEKHPNRVLCIAKGKYSDKTKHFRLLMSDNFFNDGDEIEPTMSSGRTVAGMANMASVKGYLVAAAKADRSNELALYVTKDTETWHRAEFGDGKIEEDAYTILESTNYSIQVDVMSQKAAAIGSLYTSNSNGTYFTKNIDDTNRSPEGYVDFEKVANIQGIVLVNVVDNAKSAVQQRQKKLKSKISFDDGREWESLKAGKDELHLHSVTDLSNSGRVFSSPAPGIIMGIGNTGEYLRPYTDGDLYVSDDAGMTWAKALSEAHKYEFGDDGSVLVAVFDEGETDQVMYSLAHGQPDSWKPLKLGFKMRAHELTTVPDSTSLKFVLYGTSRNENGRLEYVVVHLDFAGLNKRTCEDKDFEVWEARNGECIMGHKQSFRRRKRDADCVIGQEFKDPVPTFEPCDCDEFRDYECDFNFKPNGKKGKEKECSPSGALTPPEGACKGDEKTYMGTSGWRKIPGNNCKGTTARDKEVEHDCGDTRKTPQSDEITTEMTKFKGKTFREYYYLERGENGDDETVVMLTDQHEAYITHDQGKKWNKAVKDNIVAIYPHQFSNDRVFFLTGTKKVYYSTNRGLHDSIHSFEAPNMPNTQMLQILQFHPKNHDWIIWIGGEHCEKGPTDPECHTLASVSQKNGIEWEMLLPYVKKCAFVWREGSRVEKKELAFCEQYTNEEMGAPVELISSTDFFKTKEVKFKSVVEFAIMSEFIIVATKGGEDGKALKVDASLDGTTFADAKFPPKFNVAHQTAYTVLDSSTHSIFLHVTVNPNRDQEYGSIIKSNSNGTSYVLSLNAVNRNTDGYVDFEKMQGIEGVALANVVANVKDVDGGAKKQKKTLITHNDGADWIPLQAPDKDLDGKKWKCDVGNKEKCSLHLHGYTERADPRETFSSPTAVGIMMGVGNVGEQLGTMDEASTWITTDAGITWREVMKGTFAWEFGDQGSAIVLVQRGKDTRSLFYSLDSGKEWKEFEFANERVRVDAITTVPSDTSLNFLIWGHAGEKLVTINVDFSGLKEFAKQCELDDHNPTAGDYELWSPQHPILDEEEQCLFGHVAEYHRKRSDRKCYNGKRIDHLHNIARNCTCTRRDFECDYNYERLPGGECKPIQGLDLPDPKAVCSKKGVKEYWDITGYRKIPISTCEGGKEMEHTSAVHACPGWEDWFNRKHGLGGFGIFLIVIVSFVAAGGIGYYIWRNWDGKFGRIRLGDNYTSLDSDSPLISWPVAAISALVAVVAAVPLLIGSLWKMVAGRFGGYGGRTYTSRSSFARGRGDYAVVDPDEGELLGEDSDEDV